MTTNKGTEDVINRYFLEPEASSEQVIEMVSDMLNDLDKLDSELKPIAAKHRIDQFLVDIRKCFDSYVRYMNTRLAIEHDMNRSQTTM